MRGTVAKRVRAFCKQMGWTEKSDIRKVKKAIISMRHNGLAAYQRGVKG